jgi:predicted flap endonuclease-1-like 5' DNA nuclease
MRARIVRLENQLEEARVREAALRAEMDGANRVRAEESAVHTRAQAAERAEHLAERERLTAELALQRRARDAERAERTELLAAEVERARARLEADHASERERFTAEREHLEHELDLSRRALERAQRETERLTSLGDGLRARLEAGERALGQVEALGDALGQAEARASELASELAERDRAIAEISGLRSELELEISRARDERDRLAAQHEALRSLATARSERIRALEAALAERTRAMADVERSLAEARSALPQPGDDLQRIRGIGPKFAERLRALGVLRYADVACWQPEDVERVARQLAISPSRIHQEDWMGSAARLMGRLAHAPDRS